MITRPMLAPNELPTDEQLFFPCMVTPKVDGIRAVKVNGKLVSRSFKAIPNHHIRTTLEAILPDGMDGEIISGDNFQDCTSAVMTRAGKPEFVFHIFDYVTKGLDEPYMDRAQRYIDWFHAGGFRHNFVLALEPITIGDIKTLRDLEQDFLSLGYPYEGAMLRAPFGRYKCGRATLPEALLYKFKQFDDSEAIIEGFIEQETNENKQKKNALGLTERSHAQAGKRKIGTLGTLLVRDIKTGVSFKIGTGDGLTKQLRQEIWDRRDYYLGKMIKYKFQVHGVKDKPRCPSFQGFRHADDT